LAQKTITHGLHETQDRGYIMIATGSSRTACEMERSIPSYRRTVGRYSVHFVYRSFTLQFLAMTTDDAMIDQKLLYTVLYHLLYGRTTQGN